MDDPESTTFILAYGITLFLIWLFAHAERNTTLRSQSALERLIEQARPAGYRFLARTTTKRRIILALAIGDLLAQLVFVVVSFKAAGRLINADVLPAIVAYALAGAVTLIPLLWIHFVSPSTRVVEDISLGRVRVAAPIIMVWMLICWPLVWPLDRLLIRRARQPKSREAREEALLALVEDDTESGIIEVEKREMISSIMTIDETTVKEVMVPRVDIIAIERNRSIPELLELFAETQHSRIPIYEDRVDNIVGIVHAKDVLQMVYTDHSQNAGSLTVGDFAKESSVLFVPTTKRINELLRELRREKKHMAIAVDEYGGTAGIITMEDILEEIVGEIQDEYDIEEELPYRWINEQQIEVDASMDIADVNELIGSNLPEENGYDTLGGFLYHIFSAVPESGMETQYDRHRFVVRNVASQRIDKVLIEKLEPVETAENGGTTSE